MIGASPPRPKCEISVTAAAKIAATPPSIALPPGAHEPRAGIDREGAAGRDDAVRAAHLAAHGDDRRLLRQRRAAQRERAAAIAEITMCRAGHI